MKHALCVVPRMTGADEGMVNNVLQILQGRNLIKEMEPGKWVRKVLDDKTGGHTHSVISHSVVVDTHILLYLTQ